MLFSLLDLSEASAGGNSINIVSWPSAGPPAGAAFLEGFAVVRRCAVAYVCSRLEEVEWRRQASDVIVAVLSS